MDTYPEASIAAVKLNIPGNVKTSPKLVELFNSQLSEITNDSFDMFVMTDRLTGPEAFLIFSTDCNSLKQKMILFEDKSDLGRLFDIDVMARSNNYNQLSRSSLGENKRKCFVCHKNAKNCAKSGNHSIVELRNSLDKMYEKTRSNF